MLEKDMIQSRGFRNIVRDGEVVGFQLRIRTQYYRGIWASLLEGAEVTVDGVSYASDAVEWTIGNKTFGLAELESSANVRWPFDEAATLSIPQRGGLSAGMHSVSVAVFFRASYMPASMQPWAERSDKKMTLVH